MESGASKGFISCNNVPAMSLNVWFGQFFCYGATTFSVTALSIMGSLATLNTQHNDVQQNVTQHNGLICDTEH